MINREAFEILLVEQEEPTAEDAKELQILLGNKSLLKVLGRIQRQANDIGNVRSLDLNSEEGLNKARETQGIARGLLQALDMVYEVTEEIDDEN